MKDSVRTLAGLTCALILLVLLLASAGNVRAATGYQDLDSPAAMVKLPQQTAMIAITSAGQRLVAGGVHGVIVTSDDDGKTWRQSAVPVDVTLTAIYFKTASEGWAVGHYGVVLHSIDGGLHWRLALTGLDVIKAMQGVAAGLQSSAPGAQPTALQTKVATVFQRGGPDQPFLAVGACGGGILAAGAKDMAMFTADDGKTWQDWTPNIINPRFRMIYAVLSLGKEPLLVGETGMVAFGDPACSRHQALPPTSMPTLFGALALNDRSLLVYGLNGSAFTTSNGGATWLAGNVPAQEIITAGIVAPGGEIILGTLSGHFYVSLDNGATFHQASLSVPFQVAGVAQAGNGSLVVAGNGGVAVLPAGSLQ